MRMDEIGYNHKHDRNFYIDRPNGAGDWLMLILKAPAFFRINGSDVRTPANSFILYTPEYPQYYHPDCDEYYDDWIHFGPDDDELEIINELEIPLNMPVALSDVADISAIAKNMCYEFYSLNKYRKQIVDLYFKTLLYKIGEKMLQKTDSTAVAETIYFDKLLWIRESIYRWPSRDYVIDDMAKDIGLSRSRFQHLYTDTFGISVSRDLINSRMSKAAELLKTTDLSVKDVGILIGYGNTSYFIKVFRNTFGVPPLKYKSLSAEEMQTSSGQL